MISETWFNKRHTDQAMSIPGYNLYRRDRPRRRAGGVAIYITTKVQSNLYLPMTVDNRIELLWIKAGLNKNMLYNGVLYHPPTTSVHAYTVDELLEYIQLTIDNIMSSDDSAIIILAGDCNQLSDASVQALGLISVVDKPTHKGKKLDRIYTSQPLYNNSKVVQSPIKTFHRAYYS